MLFISPQKSLSFSKYLRFYLYVFDRVAKQLDQKDKVNFKIYDVTSWLTNNFNTRDQTMKFDPLIDYNERIIFIKKLYTKCGGETSPRPFSVKLKLRISLDQQSKVLKSLFLLYAKLRATAIY